MAFERCPCCVGKKTIVALGGMIKDCKECNGVGHVKPVVVVEKKKRKPRVTSKEE